MLQQRRCRFALVLSLLLLPVFTFAADSKPSTPKVRAELVVSAEWLSQHLNDPKVVVLHVAGKRSEYDSGHIPGARFLALDDFI
ncbi:MAG TPA: rhodanese-like domain-containing protein, partial [Alphaproteobacteria bacterium]|nr:rhodanese-like domain-containing protein [Alphaproteobacteria bacterium]